ncbi:MAG: type II toxin-antitoxin system VapC family toxin [Chloroflexi bacterium]|nr:type II toxin-antitoxin system VapC family toxin [Chloroflexota bacterium]
MFVVDASVWVSMFLSGDINHEASYRWLHRVIATDVLVAPAVLLPELAGAVARQEELSAAGVRATEIIRDFANVRIVEVDSELAEASARIAAECRMKGADALYVALAAMRGVPLVTWDREQIERGRVAATVVTPMGA